MVEQNPYTVLGVRTQASEQEIHDAYRRLAKAHHPDLHPGDKLAEENFKEIAAAYELLSDAERRAEFDRSDAQAAGAERPHAYSPDRGYDGAWFEAQAEAVADGGEFVATQRRMRPWALICLGLLLIFAMGYGVARGISLSVDGVVVQSERTTAALDAFLVLGRTGSRSRIGFEHSVRGGDGQYQTIMAGPICSRLSSASLPVGTRLHKEAWNPRYELNGQPLGSNLTIGCSVKLGFWFVFALGLISVGLIDWANSRAAREVSPAT